jgi:hypothetical protein
MTYAEVPYAAALLLGVPFMQVQHMLRCWPVSSKCTRQMHAHKQNNGSHPAAL